MIPNGLFPLRSIVLSVALAERGTREATGRNDGDVLKYVPESMRGNGLPYCAWFVGWCWEQALGKHPYGRRIGGVWDLYRAAKERDEVVVPMSPWPSPGPQPGDAFVIFHRPTYAKERSPGHTGFVLRVSEGGETVTTIEGNLKNGVGMATRCVGDFAALITPYARLGEPSNVSWERGLIDAPRAGGFANTR